MLSPGSIVPVAPGKMRNIWYPRRYAQYIPQAEIKQLRLKNTPIERDYEYGKEKPQTAQIGQAAAQPEQPAGAREPRVKAAAIELLTVSYNPPSLRSRCSCTDKYSLNARSSS